MNIDEAKSKGALAFFGDKYDDDVRVVNIGDFSKELCGGTHVHNSHDVGLIVLLQESSIGSNLRRVEMLSGKYAYEFLIQAQKSYKSVADILQVAEDGVSNKIQKQLETLETYEEKIRSFRNIELTNLIEEIKDKIEKINQHNVYIDQLNLETPNELRNFALQIVNETDVDITILYSSINGKNTIVGATKNNVSLDISHIITEISKLYGGGASKDADLSIGGGPNNFDTLKTLNIAKELILKES